MNDSASANVRLPSRSEKRREKFSPEAARLAFFSWEQKRVGDVARRNRSEQMTYALKDKEFVCSEI